MSAARDAAALAAPPASSTRAGILLMLLTMIFFVSADATAKYLMRSYPVIEVTWGRFLFHFILLIPFLLRRGPMVFRSAKPRLQLARSVLQIGSTLFYFGAIAILPLATAVTISFVQPLLITMLSVPLLGERVGPRRWAAVLVGFVGVIVIIRPAGLVEWAAVLPLGSAACSAFYNITTRLVARLDRVETSLFFTAVGGFLMASVAVPFAWQAPSLSGWLLMAMTGTLSGTGHFCIIQAYQRASATVLAPFSFTQLIWATLIGFVLFGDLPDGWTVLGAAIIVGSGLYTFYRESVRRGAHERAPT